MTRELLHFAAEAIVCVALFVSIPVLLFVLAGA
jgi:hypothetical protein